MVKGLDFSGPMRKTIKDASAVQNAPKAIIWVWSGWSFADRHLLMNDCYDCGYFADGGIEDDDIVWWLGKACQWRGGQSWRWMGEPPWLSDKSIIIFISIVHIIILLIINHPNHHHHHHHIKQTPVIAIVTARNISFAASLRNRDAKIQLVARLPTLDLIWRKKKTIIIFYGHNNYWWQGLQSISYHDIMQQCCIAA